MNNQNYSLKNKYIFVAGANGMVGSALVRRLQSEDCTILAPGRKEIDLTDAAAVDRWFAGHKPQTVFMAAAKVGGIMANATYPAEFLAQNLAIELNIMQSSFKHGVEKYLFLGSSWIYPKAAPQPLKEEYLMTGPLEPTNEAYAVAKIAGIYLQQSYRRQYGVDYISAMPCNLYGPGDRFNDPQNSHVIPALLYKIHAAKTGNEPRVTLWGTGTPLREFLYVDDLADGLVHVMQNYSDSAHINIGSGDEITIEELARSVAEIVGYGGRIEFDSSKPDGTMRKVMDNSKINALGWAPKTNLQAGLKISYEMMLQQK